MNTFLAITLAALSTIATVTQGFPWEIFKSRTLPEVIEFTTKAIGPDDSGLMAQNQYESKVQVVYTGQSRLIPPERKWFIASWFGMLRAQQKELADHYQLEYLYKEDSREYWLPTQTAITKYFDKELKPGDKMDLYLISIGGYRTQDKKIDCVLLIEEFQRLKDQ